jgi:hypothetical protein
MPSRSKKLANTAVLFLAAMGSLPVLADSRPCRQLEGSASSSLAGCDTKANFQIVAGNQVLQRPTVSPDEADSGSFVMPQPASPAVSTPNATRPIRALDTDRKVRVVGPRFLPDPAGAINLRAPGQTKAR